MLEGAFVDLLGDKRNTKINNNNNNNNMETEPIYYITFTSKFIILLWVGLF